MAIRNDGLYYPIQVWNIFAVSVQQSVTAADGRREKGSAKSGLYSGCVIIPSGFVSITI